jgi:hypothetical protein
MSTITKIFIHHTGGTQANSRASTINTTAEQVNAYHRQRWPDFPSVLKDARGQPYFGGYTALIEKDGKLTQFRPVGAETAAVKGHNFDSVSFCLSGNHPTDMPTWEQRAKLKHLLIAMLQGRPGRAGLIVAPGTTISIPRWAIYPHRWGQPGTECNGLTMNFGPSLVSEYLTTVDKLVAEINRLWALVVKLRQSKSLGGQGGCLAERG